MKTLIGAAVLFAVFCLNELKNTYISAGLSLLLAAVLFALIRAGLREYAKAVQK